MRMKDPISALKLEVRLTTSFQGKTTNRIHKTWAIDLNHVLDFASVGQDPAKMIDTVCELVVLAIAKGSTYGDSWRKKGELLSIWPNVMRKYDRVENSIMQQASGSSSFNVAPRIDGTSDFSVYGLLYLQFLAETYPDLYEKWRLSEVVGFIEDNLGPLNVTQDFREAILPNDLSK